MDDAHTNKRSNDLSNLITENTINEESFVDSDECNKNSQSQQNLDKNDENGKLGTSDDETDDSDDDKDDVENEIEDDKVEGSDNNDVIPAFSDDEIDDDKVESSNDDDVLPGVGDDNDYDSSDENDEEGYDDAEAIYIQPTKHLCFDDNIVNLLYNYIICNIWHSIYYVCSFSLEVQNADRQLSFRPFSGLEDPAVETYNKDIDSVVVAAKTLSMYTSYGPFALTANVAKVIPCDQRKLTEYLNASTKWWNFRLGGEQCSTNIMVCKISIK